MTQRDAHLGGENPRFVRWCSVTDDNLATGRLMFTKTSDNKQKEVVVVREEIPGNPLGWKFMLLSGKEAIAYSKRPNVTLEVLVVPKRELVWMPLPEGENSLPALKVNVQTEVGKPNIYLASTNTDKVGVLVYQNSTWIVNCDSDATEGKSIAEAPEKVLCVKM